jgi:hypothetical protein
VPLPTVVDVDVRQSLTQQARGVFSVRVHIQRPHGIEIVTMDDIAERREPHGTSTDSHMPRHSRSHPAQAAAAQPVPTHPAPTHPVPTHPAPTHPAPAQPAAPGPGLSSLDPIEQLRRLGELRDAGVVTEAEFAAKKAEVLRRL